MAKATSEIKKGMTDDEFESSFTKALQDAKYAAIRPGMIETINLEIIYSDVRKKDVYVYGIWHEDKDYLVRLLHRGGFIFSAGNINGRDIYKHHSKV